MYHNDQKFFEIIGYIDKYDYYCMTELYSNPNIKYKFILIKYQKYL